MADQQGLGVVGSVHLQTTSNPLSASQTFPSNSDSFPEVVPLEFLNGRSPKPEVIQALEEKEKWVVSGPSGETSSALVNSNSKPHMKRLRPSILIGAGILVLVVVVSVVGGVIGNRHRSSVSPIPTYETQTLLPTTPSKSPPTTLPTSLPTSPTSIHLRPSPPRLAVSGWRTTGGIFYLRVFYQDKDNTLWFLKYSSDGSSWGSSKRVECDSILSNTALGATLIRYYSPPQYELFFVNKSFQVNGNNFQEGIESLDGLVDSVDGYPVSLHSQSRLGMYWPYTALQQPDLTLHIVEWTGVRGAEWQNQSLGINALEGTSLVIVPQSTSYDSPHTAALVYQRDAGLLALHSLEFGKIGYEWSVVPINQTRLSSFGAFAVARENDPGNATDIYILYQTASNDLQYVYYRGDSWQLGSASDVLKHADASTDITCLTESIWYGQGSMSAAYDMSRCYFLSGGQIKEVTFDGTMWTDMGYVPLR
ncbi:hypothetical protein F4825DRAFT_451690 [Nemania diffusa]|nr:hypothetical protein F4825DRAFT_451690 [Nemania diffusa]